MNLSNIEEKTRHTGTKASIFSLQNIKKNRFVRNVIIVATGSAGAQAISLAFSPVITRIYGPEAFGVLGTFMALISVIATIAALSFPIAIVIPQSDHEAKRIVKLSAYTSFLVVCIVTLTLLTFGNTIISAFGIQEIKPFVMLIPLVVIFSAWQEIVGQWLVRKKLFVLSARVAVIQSLLVNSAKVAVGIFKPISAALIFITTIGIATNAAFLTGGSIKGKFKPKKQTQQPQLSLWALAKKYYDFPLYRSTQTFIHSISQSLPVFMLASYVGTSYAGFYILCMKLLSMPMVLIGASVGDVFYPHISEAAHRGEDLCRPILKTTAALAAIGIIPFLLIIIFGPWLFGVIFGSQWQHAGKYASWLAVWIFVTFISQPSIKVLPVISAQGFHLIFTIYSIGITMAVITIGFSLFKSDLVTIALLGISGAVNNGILIAIVLYKTCKADKNRSVHPNQ
ncbi:O-antigen flippase Wzx [Chitinispirillum alkaliphilum]|nr:O-antigen flippase Wzx [Chitinispirillum alkaliphilum]